MQAGIKCGQCGKLNRADRIYCIQCGRFLAADVSQKEPVVAAWELEDQKVSVTDSYDVVICPQCGVESRVDNGMLPLCCSCGYFFQAGIDSIVKKHPGDRKNNPNPFPGSSGNDGKIPSRPDIPDKTVKKDPLGKKIEPDKSSLRLIVLNRPHKMPESIREPGGILGKNGMIFPWLQTQQQILFTHTPVGWYAKVLSGIPLYNNVPCNTNIQLKLQNGDLFLVDKEQILVEII